MPSVKLQNQPKLETATPVCRLRLSESGNLVSMRRAVACGQFDRQTIRYLKRLLVSSGENP